MLKEVADCGNLKYEGVHNDWKLLDPPKATTTTFVNLERIQKCPREHQYAHRTRGVGT